MRVPHIEEDEGRAESGVDDEEGGTECDAPSGGAGGGGEGDWGEGSGKARERDAQRRGGVEEQSVVRARREDEGRGILGGGEEG